ncbi:hypothetical protein HRR80_005697 [Exophiala dermatitidis]|uniref:LIM zinc-binding domain-containing protein n=1 Tax=Exophiala dermatitidis TaxID=5970 RepID=A0AAN6ISX2_EXODE|nr:hypothetical protein HRR76_004452 [Exophiala dermatitidis]KAJ4559314.1 hypothetical protein HRR79_008337 [Exophiala dermatitidis]KAJ8990209.1 hypothetical protein HRR80_005697 [Exophiala dermatitidis]KAJ8997381.1 hypothetical protein HRR94_007624 [Exophiala dermatitidis]
MFHKRSSLGGRKVSPPQPTCMTAEQKSTYLESLRSYRPARPTGSRPPPFLSKTHATSASQTSLTRSDSAPSVGFPDSESQRDGNTIDSEHQPAVHKSVSFSSTSSSLRSRPLARPPHSELPVVKGRKVSPTAIVQIAHSTDDNTYVESSTRKLEKEEAHSLREALELIDHKDDERRIYEAAQNEAADLVWKHQNPRAAEEEKTAAYGNPDLKMRKRSSGFRQASGTRKVSFPNPESQIYEEPEQKSEPSNASVKPPSTTMPLRVKSRNTLPWLRRKVSDKTEAAPLPDAPKIDRFEIHKNPPSQSHNAGYRANTPPPPPVIDVIEEVDTPKSKRSLEIRSEEIRAATSMKRKDRSPNLPTPTAVSDQVGRPIVSFNPAWKPAGDSPRASREMDRPVIKLTESPTTARVSERPLPKPMPNVSEVTTVSAPTVPTINLPDNEPSQSPNPAVPSLTVSAPAVPTINLPDDEPQIPVISINDDSPRQPSVPTINVQGEIKRPTRPLPQPSSASAVKPTVQKSSSGRLPWLSRHAMPTVSCSSCALPISGRIVTASGSSTSSLKARFHPECFSCYHCSTLLECVSFYPEPDERRLERLRSMGIDDPNSAEAANDPLRFYCHLDFHEFFSPRCRSCKTPIEGEVIVAAGAEWHVGHFFCAECGDPFDSTTPFVERDNYAYCVSCHTKRTSARCRECKQQILDELTVEALGGKYHERCFVCFECGGGFGDEGRFFVRDVDVKPTDKELRKGITRKFEEKPVCGTCEERRLKAW